jgi:hypothetical protein
VHPASKSTARIEENNSSGAEFPLILRGPPLLPNT